MAPDPREEVPGELAAIDETLTTMTKLGTAFENAAQGFQKINTTGWEGATADAFQDYFRQEPPKWIRAADAFTAAAAGLRDYVGVLEWAQRQAVQACAEIADAERRIEVARAQFESSGATVPFQDPGAAARETAQAKLGATKEQVEQAAREAARVLLEAAEDAPPQPGPLTLLSSGVEDIFQNVAEGCGEFWKSSFDGALGLIQQARVLNPFDPYNITHPQQYGENLSNLAAGTIAAGKTFISDPIGTGKAIIDAGIDGFTKDPFGTVGRLAPDVAAGLATGGSSTAGSLGRRVLTEVTDYVKGKGDHPASSPHGWNIPPHNPPNPPGPRPESAPPPHPLSHVPGPPHPATPEQRSPSHGWDGSSQPHTPAVPGHPHPSPAHSDARIDADEALKYDFRQVSAGAEHGLPGSGDDWRPDPGTDGPSPGHPEDHDGLTDEHRAAAEVARKIWPDVATLSDHEITALSDYRDTGYKPVNTALRTDDIDALAPAHQDMIKHLDSALEQIPHHTGDPVYRGITVNPDDLDELLARYTPGELVTENAYTSTSKEAPFKGNVEFIIDSVRGRDISAMNLDEAEVLFERGTDFLVTDRYFDPHQGTWKIFLTDPPE
ncbi:putative T7SS-secreted protein [Saccharopolyspora hattusasensis]|uniref:putative T7SS-secreted protein n=1 Tax=Saccharopolyspora hattusasensis TaxID=1128679 RepID=UPI003D993313